MKRVPALVLALAAASSLALAGCTSSDDIASNSAGGSATIPSYDVSGIQKQEEIAALLPESVAGDGKLTVGAATDYAPAEFLDSGGQAVGYDVDLTHAIAAVLGLDPVTSTAEFDSIIPAVGTKYDLGISSFTITAQREASATFISYISVGSQFNVAEGNPSNVDPSDPMNLCGLTIGVQTGTDQADTLEEYTADCEAAGNPAIIIKSFSSHSDAATALAGGTLDATFADSTVASYAQVQTNGAVVTVGEIIDAAPQGIVVAQGDEATAQAVQEAVQYLMESGEWNKILETWGIDPSQALDQAEINPAV